MIIGRSFALIAPLHRHFVAGLALAATVLALIGLAPTNLARASLPMRRVDRASLLDVRTLQNRGGATLVAWLIKGGRIAIAYRDSGDVSVVRGASVTHWSDGRRLEIIYYHSGGLWRQIFIRFGVTRAEVMGALTSGPVVQINSPLQRTVASAGSTPPSTFTTVQDYGTNLSGLRSAAGITVYWASTTVLGYKLGDTFVARVANPYQSHASGPKISDSGAITTLVYSTDISKLGAGDHQIVLSLTDESTQAGKASATFLKSGAAVVAGAITAYKANANQIVFKIGHAVGVVTTTVILKDSDWKVLLRALRTT